MTDKAHSIIYLDHLLPGSFLYEDPAPFQFHHVSEAQIHQYKYELAQQPKKKNKIKIRLMRNVLYVVMNWIKKKTKSLSVFRFIC